MLYAPVRGTPVMMMMLMKLKSHMPAWSFFALTEFGENFIRQIVATRLKYGGVLVTTFTTECISWSFFPIVQYLVKMRTRVRYYGVSLFTARCNIVHSAVLRLHVVRPSVRLSVCDVGGSGPHRLEIWRTISPTPSLFLAQRPPIYSQGNMGKFGGD